MNITRILPLRAFLLITLLILFACLTYGTEGRPPAVHIVRNVAWNDFISQINFLPDDSPQDSFDKELLVVQKFLKAHETEVRVGVYDLEVFRAIDQARARLQKAWTAERGFMSKVWLITGASRGLGRAFTQAVLDAGDRVIATARKPEQLVGLKGRYSERVRTVALDVTNEAQAKAAFEGAITSFGGLDVLVNNAGYGYVCPVEDTSLADFRAQIETNLFGVIIMTKAVLPYFRERRAGHIIQVTSIAGRIGPAGRAPYAAAKFGVEGFSESLFKEIGPLGIKVTIIEPGGFRTDFAGSSTQLSEGRPEYDSTVGAAVRFQRSYNGRQPGDPAKAAAALLHVTSLSEPPLRLLLGSDSYAAAEKSALDKIESDKHWKDVSLSTDDSSDETHV